MRYREIINEGVTGIDAEAIIRKMAESILDGKYWDDYALSYKPELGTASDGTLEDIIHDFGDELSPEAQNDPKHEEVKALIYRWTRGRFNEIAKKLGEIPKAPGGLYRIHRVMCVPLERFQIGGSLGLYWTYDLEEWDSVVGAYAIWAKSDNSDPEVTIEALVSPAQVDWFYTFLANMDWFSGNNEFEMRLLKDAPLKIVKVTEGNKEVPVSPTARFVG